MSKLFEIDKTIYDKLVEDENDILGIIAFSLYKKQQINWLKSNSEINDSIYASFLSFVNSEQQIANYKEKAITLAEIFAKELYQNELDQINLVANNAIDKFKQDLNQEFERKFKDKVKNFNPKFFIGVYQGIVSSFLFTLLIGILFFFTWSLQKGPKDIIENIFQVKITSINNKNNEDEKPKP